MTTKNLLVGNGINIQFDLHNYTTRSIVLRILEELDSSSFPRNEIVDEPTLLKFYMGKLFLSAREMLDGEFDKFTISKAEKIALQDFKERYKSRQKSLRITDIGFEDYYLIHDLLCHKEKIYNPEAYVIREMLKMAYYYSIYNHGELNKLHANYSPKFISYLQEFDNIFSTNYDSNIELATSKEVHHLHGHFDCLSEIYNPNSFRVKVDATHLEDFTINPELKFLYSNAVSTYCGDYKQYQLKEHQTANNVIKKFADGYKHDDSIKTEIEDWKTNSNELVSRFGKAIELKVNHPELEFQEYYPVKELSEITGTLTILGLSPYNDYHLFNIIDNAQLEECIYYYFNEDERETVKKIFPNLEKADKLKFMDVRDFWEEMK